MNLKTRWLIDRTTEGAPFGRPGGRFPSFFKHYDPRKPGVWCGVLDLGGMDFQVASITWDLDIVGQAEFDDANAVLEAAPDEDALEIPEDLGQRFASWNKKNKLRDEAGRGKLDRDRPKNDRSIGDGLREIVREVLLQQSLAVPAFLKARARGDKLKDLPRAARDNLDKRRGRKLRRWRDADTVHEWLSRILDAGFARHHVERGGFHLGRREANLG
jgi:hypothetical protein